MSTVLQRAFQHTNIEAFRARYFPVTCDIPSGREPEFGIRLSDINDAFILEDEFMASPQVRLIEPPVPHKGVLVSLAQDVVDKNGMPLATLSSLGIESRRRFSLNPTNGNLIRFDVSFKDAGKTDLRREWEGAADSLHTGHEEAMQKLSQDVPEITMIDPQSFRIIGPCLAARSSNYHRYLLADSSAMLTLETNDDACIFSTPHADRILGHRFEREPEVKYIHLPRRADMSDAALHRALDKGLAEIRRIIDNSRIRTRLSFEEVSKGGEIVNRVAEHYEAEDMYDGLDGRETALLQNVVARAYYTKATMLCRLAAHIPSSLDISRRTIPEDVTTAEKKIPASGVHLAAA